AETTRGWLRSTRASPLAATAPPTANSEIATTFSRRPRSRASVAPADRFAVSHPAGDSPAHLATAASYASVLWRASSSSGPRAGPADGPRLPHRPAAHAPPRQRPDLLQRQALLRGLAGQQAHRTGLGEETRLARHQLVRAWQQPAPGVARPDEQRPSVERHLGPA